MTRITKTAFKTIDEIYKVIPDVGCTGACGAMCCKRVIGSRQEMNRAKQAGVDLTTSVEDMRLVLANSQDPRLQCQAWDADKGCVIYSNRPLVCRVWGASIDLICPHGCKPKDAQYLSSAETIHLINEADRIGGRASMAKLLPILRAAMMPRQGVK